MACRVSEKAPEMRACDAITVAALERPTSASVAAPGRDHREERVLGRRRLAQDERALSEVAEHQRWHRQGEPGHADGARAEVPHVGVQRLATRHRQHDRAEDEEARHPVRGEVVDGMVR